MKNDNKMNFTVDLKSYSLESVYQAAAAMLDRLYFRFDKTASGLLKAEIKPKKNIPARDAAALKDEFFNELLNAELRMLIARRTRKIREALIAQALIGASTERGEYTEDPLGIALPWEEKYGGAKKKKAARTAGGR